MTVVREFREAWRRLAKRPGYTLLSIAVLGVGLGVVVFLFGAINSFVLQPLPFPHADRLVALGEPTPDAIGAMDSSQYLRLKGNLRSLDTLGAMAAADVSVDGGAGAVHYDGAEMSASLLSMLGVRPILGRNLDASDEMPGATPAVLLGEDIWRHAFNGDPRIVGRSVRVDGEWATVVGVLPASFGFPGGAGVWLPLRLQPNAHRAITVEGRLAPSVRLSQVRAELAAWAGRLQRALPPGSHAKPLAIGPMSAGFVAPGMVHWIWLMLGAGVLVLLLACINVANLQLVKTLRRRHELALRSALGSSRARLVLGALAESLLLGVAALALAFPIALACTRWIKAVLIELQPSLQPFMRGIDGWVIAFGIVAAVTSTLLAGGGAAWRASRANLQDALRDGGRGTSGGGFARVAKVMVMAEIALTVVLLVGAGMFVRSVDHLLAAPAVGATHAANVLTASVMLPPTRYRNDSQRIRFLQTVAAQLRRDPGVVGATASNSVPSAEVGGYAHMSLPGDTEPADGWPWVQTAIVDPHFLDTYGVRLLKGRFFDARDGANDHRVVVIDARLAAKMWPHQDPLDQTLVLHAGTKSALSLRVVGVVQTLQLDGATQQRLPSLLVPLSQAAGLASLDNVGLAIRTHARATTSTQLLAKAVHAVDSQAAVYSRISQIDYMALTHSRLTVLSEVFSALGLIALLLAAAGLYGVLAFSVEQRTREIGIRRAVGAGGAAIVRQVGRQLFWQLGIGVVVGIVLALPWSAMLADPMFRTRADDPAVFVPVLALVIGVSVLAAWVPMLRALRVAPAVALRYE